MKRIEIRWIVFCFIFFVFVLVGYIAFQRQNARLTQVRVALNENYREATSWESIYQDVSKQWDEIRGDFPHKGERVWFLERLQEQSVPGLIIKAVGPLKKESLTHYDRISRTVEIEADYFRLARFINNLERIAGFAINDFSIERSKSSIRHKASLTLISLELNDQKDVAPIKPGMLMSLIQKARPKPAATPRDPMRVPVRREDISAGKRPEDKKPGPIDLSDVYSLDGIIYLPDKKIGVIKSTSREVILLKEQEWLGNKKVISIEKDRVFLSNEQGQYFIRKKE